MINRVPALAVAGLLAAGLAALPGATSATPLTGVLAIANATPGNVEAVRWAGGGGGRGPVVAGPRGYGGGYGRGPVGGPGWRGPGGGGPVYGGGGGWGYGVGAAVVGGAIIGGALAAPYYGYGPYYPAPYPYYAEPVYEAAPEYAPPPPDVYAPPPGAGAYGPPPGGGGDPSGYCAQRYRSYDPASGTYIGNDGLRHPCP
jgi:hypothetical protein